ncbi:chromosome segregation ATPase [Aphanothece hegewaldii CCALA 016]|uniref:Chromosome segregation ATPase n=1 Tax=Aphanothece hegewaldii CCALA 016 TaxID=2107694 RepID=A0A2T1M3Q8_9CHRO|nr:chromosome segregation ATPase [Aphanothece hegewaldii]PSF39452.1 chromosome segregation ATPase [Aphanothece hegewaldii CCALA 016]
MRINRKDLAPQIMVQASDKLHNKATQFLEQMQEKISLPIWATILVVLSGTIGFTATSVLLKSPTGSGCPKIIWLAASASQRLYCAQLEADRKTTEGLLKAIALVEALPSDHPLRPQVNQYVEDWAEQILTLAEKEYQAGRIENAIATVKKIPSKAKVYELVEKRIEKWESIWKEGEQILTDIETSLRKSNWNYAFRKAVELLNLNNEYWATVKYNQAVQKIYLAREESNQLDQAFALYNRGGLENWLKAVKETEKIKPDSYAYQEAKNLFEKVKEKLITYGNNLAKQQQWQDLKDVANQIPENLALDKEVGAWIAIADAGINADFGTVEGLQAAILSAEQIEPSSPFYSQAQDMRKRWNLEIEDVTKLTQAREKAQSGDLKNLTAAIAQANLIVRGHPRYSEAQGEINRWTRQVQLIEDQPILDKAREISVKGDIESLKVAIAQAKEIGSQRALYKEAQGEIRTWQESIEKQEDQPILDQAISLANVRDYVAAIQVAQQIRRGRVLYPETRANLRRWQQEVQAQKDLQQAYSVAQTRTVEALNNALNLVRNIPTSTDVSTERMEAIDRWSYQLLAFASEKANLSLYTEAISIARQIPNESAAYSAAQSQVKIWRRLLEPPLPPLESSQDNSSLDETEFEN